MLQPRLKKVNALPDLHLFLTWDTGEVTVFDMHPYIDGSWYSELKAPSYFNLVRLLPDGKGIEWPDGQDVAPHELCQLPTAYRDWGL